MVALITTKIGMISIIDDLGNWRALTLLAAKPATVTQVKTSQTDGYNAWQIGSGVARRPKKPQAGRAQKLGLKATPAIVKEIRQPAGLVADVKVGDRITVGQFRPGDKVEVVGTTKGKGFAGTIKRHNFHRSPASHGSKNQRRPGSIGTINDGRVIKGKKMAGRLGGQSCTLTGLTVGLVDDSQGLLGIFGGLPGSRKSTIIVRRSGGLLDLTEATASQPADQFKPQAGVTADSSVKNQPPENPDKDQVSQS